MVSKMSKNLLNILKTIGYVLVIASAILEIGPLIGTSGFNQCASIAISCGGYSATISGNVTPQASATVQNTFYAFTIGNIIIRGIPAIIGAIFIGYSEIKNSKKKR